ncbi:hypothetical protein [Anaerosolibacter sp.]|uniref:hypothetical protein n=1 Tax=Anaerosolibacter sp. TaxID=1872527 RepID=UPI0039EFE189
MNPAIAYRAIIRLVAGDFAGYETLVSEPSHLVNVKYFYNKNKCVKAKLDTSTGDLYIGNLVRKWGRC